MSERKEMTAVDYLKARGRMTEGCDGGCNKCPLYADKNGTNDNCGKFESEHPEEAVAIVQKWAEEHPVKTRMSDFYEKYPNAKRCGDGITPQVCAKTLGYLDKCAGRGCAECWSGPLEVKP